MTQDIKAAVAELERNHAEYEKSCNRDQREIAQGQAMDTYWKVGPSLLAELRRLRAIEAAAVRYREALDVFNKQFVDRACPELAMAKQDSCNALFAALDAKPSGGEEAR